MAAICHVVWFMTYTPALTFDPSPLIALRHGMNQLHQLSWPVHLTNIASLLAPVGVGTLVSVALSTTAGVWALFSEEGYLKTCVIWLLLYTAPLGCILHRTLPPVMDSIQPGGHAALSESALYCISVPWCVLCAAYLSKLKPRMLGLGLALLTLLFFSAQTRARVQVWHSELAVHSAAVKTNPKCPDAHFQLAKLYRTHQKAGAADREIQEVLKLLPENVEARILFGELLQAQGKTDVVLKELMKAVKAAPGGHRPYTAIGEAMIEQKNYPKAEQSLKMALKFNPDYAPALNTIGEMYMQSGELEKAKGYYEKAAGRHASFYEAHNNLGTCLMRLGNAEKAVAAFDKALALPMQNPSAFLTHYNIATALQMLGRIDDAISHYETSIGLNGDYANFYFNMGIALQKKAQQLTPGVDRQNTLDKAIRAYQYFLTQDPTDAQAHYNLGYALDDRERKEEAQGMFMKARQLNPKLPPYQPRL